MGNAPVVLFQWHVESEPDELEMVRTELKMALATVDELATRMPDVVMFTSYATDGARMLDDLCVVLHSNPGMQILYFAAHGETDRTFIDKFGASVTFADFGGRLRDCLGSTDMALVLGACHAVACGIERVLPQKVRWVWGFTEKPTVQDVVCVMAAVVEDAVRLHLAMSNANVAYAAAIAAKGNSVRSEDYFGPVLVNHVPEINKWFGHARKDRGRLWMME